MPTRGIYAGVLLALLVLTGCGDGEPSQDRGATDEDRATRTLQQMLDLAERGDWDAYVDRYYGEQHKFGSPADRGALVERFEKTWGAQVLPTLRRAAELSPRVEGDKAIFADAEGQAFLLHRTDAGGWGFHL